MQIFTRVDMTPKIKNHGIKFLQGNFTTLMFYLVHFNRIIPKESDSVPMRNQDVFNSGGTFARTGSEEPCTTSWRFTDSSECSQVQHGTRSPHLGLCHTSKELLRVVSSSLCKGSSPDLHLPEAHLTKQPLPIPLPSPPGLRRSVETQNFRNSNHLPLKDDYFTLYLIEPMSGLSPLFFFFSFLFFLTADP